MMRRKWSRYRRSRAATAIAAAIAAGTGHSVLAQTPPTYTLYNASLTGGVYDSAGSNYRDRTATLFATNAIGNSVGTSNRFAADASALGQDIWFCDGRSNGFAINPSGGVFDKSLAGGIFHSAAVDALRGSSVVLGDSGEFAPDGSLLGRDVWVSPGSGSSTVVIHPTDGNHSYFSSGQTRFSTTAVAINDAGAAIGYSQRYDVYGNSLGTDGWRADAMGNVTFLLLNDATHTLTTSSGVKRSGATIAINAVGAVIGSATRYSSGGSDIGNDAWYVSAGSSSPQVIGLSGANYDQSTGTPGAEIRNSRALRINNAGVVQGTTEIASLGNDCWLYDPSSGATVRTNLSGAGYESTANSRIVRGSNPLALTESGLAVGVSGRSTFNGGDRGIDVLAARLTLASHVINLTGSEYEFATADVPQRIGAVTQVSAAGFVLGTSRRYSNASDLSAANNGTDCWVYSPLTDSTRRVNLIGNGYESTSHGSAARFATGIAVGNDGAAIGTSNRMSTDSTQRLGGTDSWLALADGSVRRIGLIGARYEFSDVHYTSYRSSLPIAMNGHDQVIGISSIYGNDGGTIGNDGWFYNPETDQTDVLKFSTSIDGASNLNPIAISDSGVVVGSYLVFSGHTSVDARAFWWSEAAGEHDLASLVASGLDAAGWSRLLNSFAAAGDAPTTIIGDGQTVGQTGGTTYFALSQVPEPSTFFATVGLSILSLQRFRRCSLR